MDLPALTHYLTSAFAHVETMESWGYTMFFFRDDRMMPFATLIAQDTEHDRVSDLNRPGVYRLNIGIEKTTFRTLFSAVGDPDFRALDRVMPHPEYAAQSWVCVLAPSDATFERDVKPLLAEAYHLAERRYQRKQ